MYDIEKKFITTAAKFTLTDKDYNDLWEYAAKIDDWSYVYKLGSVKKVHNLIWCYSDKIIKKFCDKIVCDTWNEDIQSLKRCLKEVSEQFVSIIQFFNKSGFRYLTFNGIVKSNDLYPVYWTRDFDSLYFILDNNSIENAKNYLIKELGFTYCERDDRNYHVLTYILKKEFSLSDNNSMDIFIELTTDTQFNNLIINNFSLENNNLTFDFNIWENPIIVKFEDLDICVLSLENDLIFNLLKTHYILNLRYNNKNINIKYIWFLEIREFINKYYYQIDWDVFIHKINIKDLGEKIYFSLQNINEICYSDSISYMINLIKDKFFSKELGVNSNFERNSIRKEELLTLN
ncbi:MAG: hypothetical protein A2Y34_08895 [Spirochaetes bacterium GWC1_27_15]|nr:MAG: hypothetical protein A2Y34_08895 [Spirochaetes bacterium GWC1_27_15]